MDEDSLKVYLDRIGKNCGVKLSKVIALNEIKKVEFKSFPISLIVNTDRRGSPGKHWFALYIYKVRDVVYTDYFDSYGNPFSKYKMKYPYKISTSNYVQVQGNNSSVCGEHSLFFLYYRSRGLTLPNIVKKYSRVTKINDNMVSLFVSLLQKPSVIRGECTQICCSRINNSL